MSLLDAYKNATKDWDAKKDNVSGGGYEDIPEGTYTVVLNKCNHFTSKRSGWEALSFDMQVADGDYAGRHEFVFISLATKKMDGKPMPQFVIERNVQTVAKLAAYSDVDLDDNDFDGNLTDVYEKINNKFMGHEGAEMTMKVTETNNKKNPDRPYRNYDFNQEVKPSKDDQFQKNGAPEVNDDDLPF